MAEKSAGNTDTSLEESGPQSEQQEDSGRETLGALPPKIQREVRQLLVSGRIGPAPDPLLEKLNEGHLTTILENSGKEDERAFEYAKTARRYTMAYSVIGLIAFFALTVYMMPLDKELYKQIVQVLVAAGGGFGAGYGVRYWQG